MSLTNETPPLGAAGLGADAFPGGNCSSEITQNARATQAENVRRAKPHLRLVPKSAPPSQSEPIILVRISGYQYGQPYGRSRIFEIKLSDIGELSRAAERLEARQ
jgi:hypothetical protein